MAFGGKVCVVTGGALGIGRCVSRRFAQEGASVAFIDTNRAAGGENLAFLQSAGCDALFFHGDVADENILMKFSEKVIEKFSKVDILINNACVSRRGLLSGCSYEDFGYVLRVGAVAPYMLTKLFMPVFAPNASIVNICSTRAFMSQSDTESYSAAKGAIAALTHAMAASLSGKVRVNSISPGWIDTGAYHDESYQPSYSRADTAQHTSGRVGEPNDIANAALFLCDERNGFINGQDIRIDGGMTKLMIYSGDDGWQYNEQ